MAAANAPRIRPTVFLMVEIKVREFRAKLHLAATLAQRGFRVYVGTRTAVLDAVTSRSRPTGVYYFKGGETPEVFSRVRRHCELVAGQDEEIGPALGPSESARAWRARFPAAVAEGVDEVHLFAHSQRDVLAEVYPGLARRAQVTGWPRADLWHQSRRATDDDAAARIREQHGPFTVFVSNFKVNTPELRARFLAAAQERIDRLDDPQRHELEDDDYGSRASARLAAFERCVELLRSLAPAPIVVRPHPSESVRAWHNALADAEHVQIAHGDEVGPWVLAADAMLHTGCTTAVQAAFYDIPCGFVVPVDFSGSSMRNAAPFQVSLALTDLDAVTGFVRAGREGRAARPTELGTIDHLLGPRDGRAADRIADRIAAYAVSPEPPLPASAFVGPKRSAASTYRRLLRTASSIRRTDRFVGTNAQPKVPGGTHRPEAISLLDRLDALDGLSVSEPRFDLLCIEASHAGDFLDHAGTTLG